MQAAYNLYEANPDLMISVYYQIGNSSLFLVGAIEATVILMPALSSPCVKNPLFDHLNISCLIPYKISSPGPIIEGELADYSQADGVVSLIYDLANFTIPTSMRMTALEFNVFCSDSGDIAVTKIVFERSIHGQYVASSTITVIPRQLYYFGGSGSTSAWMLVIGQILILVAACSMLLFLLGRRIVEKSVFAIPTATEVSLVVLSVLCISSFGIQYTAVTSGPLNAANIGVVKSVNLSTTASQFNSVNALNGLIIMLLFAHVVGVLIPLKADWFFLLSIALSTMVVFSVILNIRFPSVLSFKAAFNLLTRISLRYINNADFEWLASNKFEMTSLLVFYAFLTYWITGLVLGYFVGNHMKLHSAKPTIVSDPKPDETDDESGKEYESLFTSLEVMAGRAVGEIGSVKARMDEELAGVKETLSQVKERISNLRID